MTSRPTMAAVACAALLAAAPAAPCQPGVPQPVLQSSLAGEDPVSTDGTLNLSWDVGEGALAAADGAVTFELEETPPDGEAVVIDAGPYRATALSGRDNGVHRYRVRAVTESGPVSSWSEPIEVRFQHHSLALAFALFAIGAIVFLATAGLVLLGHRRARLAGS